MTKNNKQYFFILGINPELSIAEIVSLLKGRSIKFEVDLAIESVLVISCSEIEDDFFNQLGGSKKFGIIDGQVDSLDSFDLENMLDGKIKEDKFRFGFSLYNFSKNDLKRAHPKMRRVGLTYKKELKAKGVKSRLVESKEEELSSVIVHKEKMIKHGADVVLIKYRDSIFYGQTLSVQDFNAFSARDYGKPGRDIASGMLPPKLARIMLNLVNVDENMVILDPFCGSGTVILEALSMGLKNIYGSDKSETAVDDTGRNLIWWQQHYVLDDMPEIIKCSVEVLSDNYDKDSIDVIITEPFLGPSLRGRETPAQIHSIQSQLLTLYKISLEQFAKVLKPDGKVAMIWPVFVDGRGEQVFLNLKDKVNELDLEIVNCLSNIEVSVEQPTKYRRTYFYCREGQRVCREVVVLQKKN